MANSIKTSETNIIQELKSRALIEGSTLFLAGAITQSYPRSTQVTSNTGNGDVKVVSGVGAGKIGIVEKITVSVDRPCKISLYYLGSYYAAKNYNGSGSNYNTVYDTEGFNVVLYFGANTLVQEISGPWLMREKGAIIFSSGSTDANQEKPNVEVIASGFQICSDLNFNARHTIVSLGDSTTHADRLGTDENSEYFLGDAFYNRSVVDKLYFDYRKDVRFVNKGFGGAEAWGLTKMLESRALDTVKADAYFIGIGTNDCTQGAGGLAAFKANLYKIFNRLRKINPNADIFFWQPPTTDSASRTPYVQDYRDAMIEVATDQDSGLGEENGVYTADLSQAFGLNATASADVNFTNIERSSGSRTHPSGTGQQLMFSEVVWPKFITSRVYEKIMASPSRIY